MGEEEEKGWGELRGWLGEALGRLLKLEDETLVDYVESILQEESYQPHEKKDTILEFLSASTDADLSEFGEELMLRWGAIEAARKATKEEQQRQEAERQKARQLQLQQQNKEREDKLAKQRLADQQMSKEERQKRRELLERYGYQIEMTDENGDIVLTENLCDISDNAGLGFEHNDNAARVTQEAQAQRERAREKHQQKVARDKEALLKQQQEKEKRKRKTEKREKRRL